MKRHPVLLMAPSVLLYAANASAQTFPQDAAWTVLDCGERISWDPLDDEPAAKNERDIVGEDAAPALYLASDQTHLFFRMRLHEDPRTGNELRPFGWAIELDTDDDRRTYELLVVADGIDNPDSVIFYKNEVQERIDDPSDPPETTLTTYPAQTHARGAAAEGNLASQFGGTLDYFIDIAVDWSDLRAQGLEPSSRLVMVFGTSSNANAIDADIACHDGASDPRTLTGPSTETVRPDGQEVADTDGDGVEDGEEVRRGSDPTDPNDTLIEDPTLRLRGGGGVFGCSASGSHGADLLCWASLAVLGLAFARFRTSRKKP